MADTLLKAADVTAAKQAITNYRDECNRIYTNMEQTISALTALGSGGFNGDSANGYNEFFTKVAPNVTTKVEASSLQALIDGLNEILDQIKTSLLDTEDPDLGDANRNAI